MLRLLYRKRELLRVSCTCFAREKQIVLTPIHWQCRSKVIWLLPLYNKLYRVYPLHKPRRSQPCACLTWRRYPGWIHDFLRYSCPWILSGKNGVEIIVDMSIYIKIDNITKKKEHYWLFFRLLIQQGGDHNTLTCSGSISPNLLVSAPSGWRTDHRIIYIYRRL